MVLQGQLGIKVGKAAGNSEDSESEEEMVDDAAEEEDESDKWSQERRQQAVEALLGSCAGNDFAEESEPPQVAPTFVILLSKRERPSPLVVMYGDSPLQPPLPPPGSPPCTRHSVSLYNPGLT